MRASIASADTDGPVNGPAHETALGGGVRRPDSNEEELNALRRSLQEQRRATTLLNAEVQKQTEAREAMEAQLIEANAEIAASWDRRKEMTRVIADRDSKLAAAKSDIDALRERQEEMAKTIADRDSELADAKSEIEELRLRQEEMAATISDREAELADTIADWEAKLADAHVKIAEADAKLAEATADAKLNRERRKEIALVVANRDTKIATLNGKIATLNGQIKEIGQAVANRNDKISQLKAELEDRYRELATLQRHIARTSFSGRAKRLVSPITRLFR